MKVTPLIFSIAFTLLMQYGCVEKDEHPLLICDFADARQSVDVEIFLHDRDGVHHGTISTDDEGLLRYSPDYPGEIAELEFIHDGREYGAVLQKRRHAKMVIANENPIFSSDNKECNETCEAIRRMFGKYNFLHTEDCPAIYEEKTEQLRLSLLKVRQYLAEVPDNDMRECLARRVQRIYDDYLQVVETLRIKGDMNDYNHSIEKISLYDHSLYLPISSSDDFYTSESDRLIIYKQKPILG